MVIMLSCSPVWVPRTEYASDIWGFPIWFVYYVQVWLMKTVEAILEPPLNETDNRPGEEPSGYG